MKSKDKNKRKYYIAGLIVFLNLISGDAFAHCCPGPCCVDYQKIAEIDTKIVHEQKLVDEKLNWWKRISTDIINVQESDQLFRIGCRFPNNNVMPIAASEIGSFDAYSRDVSASKVVFTKQPPAKAGGFYTTTESRRVQGHIFL